jgi:dipeptidyl aminopeptidase/acylaminoacyl peptidase
MILRPGTSVGPYEILAPIGAGGMGEVYRARDPRIGREVAVKVLPEATSGEPERQHRFEKEARAAGALNHPNILAVYDVGTHEGVPYIVSELLEGETLRSRIGGSPLPTRKALDYAAQIARGLAAAHEKGIVHRDLKPENVFVTRDGRVKILDFGLAKLGEDHPGASVGPPADLSAAETATGTLPGTLLGTLGYMSPEQVQGHIPDARSDIFAFGAVLLEMVTGRKAFKAHTAPETLTAILREDPVETAGAAALPPGLERVVRHCLEKSPDERFQSARDLAFALEALSGPADTASTRSNHTRAGRHRWRMAAIAPALVVAVAGGLLAGRAWWSTPPLRFIQQTYRTGLVAAARFSPDGQTIVFSAAWEGGPLEVYSKRPDSRESSLLPTGDARARVLSVSPNDQLAILLTDPLDRKAAYAFDPGTLARVPLAGGTPRELIDQVLSADWSPDGGELAVSRLVDGVWRLEYPLGRLLYESRERIPVVRVSPHGDLVAFLEEVAVTGRIFTDSRLSVVNLEGEIRTIFEGTGTVGASWSPDGRKIWIDTYEPSGDRGLRAVDLSGQSRLLVQLGGAEAALADVSRDGRALFVRGHGRYLISALAPGEDEERDLSWRNDALLADLSPDGRRVLFYQVLPGGSGSFGAGIRETDGPAAVRLGKGFAESLSPDGRWALALTREGPAFEFALLPTGAGEEKRLSEGLPGEFHGASWLPDSQGFVFSGGSPDGTARLFLQMVEGGPPRPFTDIADDLVKPVVAPDGRTIAAIDRLYQDIVLVDRHDGKLRPLPGGEEGEWPIQWGPDGRALYVYRPDHLPVEVFEVETATGERRLLREIVLADTTGLDGGVILEITPDARAYAYSFRRFLDDLYLVEGLL